MNFTVLRLRCVCPGFIICVGCAEQRLWYNYGREKWACSIPAERQMSVLNASFYIQPTLTVARQLLGKKLVRQLNGQILSGIVVETEAYIGEKDSACHASKGKTPRTEVMFGPPGRAYVYLVYGLHSMLNVVTEVDGFPGAVLIRAIEPLEGLESMQVQRQKTGLHLTNGPAKLCQAFAIDRKLNRHDLTLGNTTWIEDHRPIEDELISTGPRIGITYAAIEDQRAPWRFWIRGNRYVSR